ncbi:MAG: NAD(+) diphosphatase [Gammaproteobacteria bacterium]|nr:NAD(+) diphosphatase [Gammaproteobacteria bacterium]
MPLPPTHFSGTRIDRAAALRRDSAALAAAWQDSAARFLPVWDARCLIHDAAAARLTRADLGALLPPQGIFLGLEEGRPLFAIALAGPEPPAIPGEFGGLRELIGRVAEPDAGLLVYARAMVNWHRQHRHCGACGGVNQVEDGGFVLACSNPGCGQRSFPRLDPAIIVLVHRDRHCLLGRQASWPAQRFSTIAGFVEPGESLEDAVRREVAEESDIQVGECSYQASQPWPFPASLMIGFHAMAASDAIRTNDAELAEARWFTREDLAAGAVVLPPRASVAFRLIEAWFDAVPGPGLATLGHDGAFLRPAGATPEQR